MATYYSKADTGFGDPALAQVLMPQVSFAQERADKMQQLAITQQLAEYKEIERQRQAQYEKELLDKLNSVAKTDYLERDKSNIMAFIEIGNNAIREKIKTQYAGRENEYIENQLLKDIQDIIGRLNNTNLLPIAENNKKNVGLIEDDEKKDKQFRLVSWKEKDDKGNIITKQGTPLDNRNAYLKGNTDEINYNGSYNMPKNLAKFYAETLDPDVSRRLNENPMDRAVSIDEHKNYLVASGLSEDDAKDAAIQYGINLQRGGMPYTYKFDNSTKEKLDKLALEAAREKQRQANEDRNFKEKVRVNDAAIANKKANTAKIYYGLKKDQEADVIDQFSNDYWNPLTALSTDINGNIELHNSKNPKVKENKLGHKYIDVNVANKERLNQALFGDKGGNLSDVQEINVDDDKGNTHRLVTNNIYSFSPSKMGIMQRTKNGELEYYLKGTGVATLEDAMNSNLINSEYKITDIGKKYGVEINMNDRGAPNGVILNSVYMPIDINDNQIKNYNIISRETSRNKAIQQQQTIE